MIRWLKAVIARLLGSKAASTETSVQPTQTAGLASQEPTQRRGNKRSALTTAPVATEPKPKRSRARSTTAEASSKPERTSVKRTAIQVGQLQETPASPTRQPAKRGRKPKQ